MAVLGSEIAGFLDLNLHGRSLPVGRALPVSNPDLTGAVVFLGAKVANEADFPALKDAALLILGEGVTNPAACPYVVSDNPRLDFARVLNRFFRKTIAPGIAPTATIGPEVVLGTGLFIGDRAVLTGQVTIGDDSVIHPGVVITGPVRIGRRCVIKSNSVIGQEGFGIATDRDGLPFRMPQIGGVVIEDDVEVGALNTVAAGTVSPTIVHSMAKFDDHVHVAHNCVIGHRVWLTACCELSGSVRIGEDALLGPNVSIGNGVTIGARASIGIGAVIIRDVPEDAVVVGNPGRIIRYRESAKPKAT